MSFNFLCTEYTPPSTSKITDLNVSAEHKMLSALRAAGPYSGRCSGSGEASDLVCAECVQSINDTFTGPRARLTILKGRKDLSLLYLCLLCWCGSGCASWRWDQRPEGQPS